MRGILLFGHGARNPDWAQPFEQIRQIIMATDASTLVEMSFLELMRPTFAEGIDILVSRGAKEIVVVPIFIAGGGHVNKDLPPLAAEAMTRHAGLLVRLARPVGEASSVLAAMADYALRVVPAE